MPPIDQVQPDSAGMALVWRLLQDVANASVHAQAPTDENGWGVVIKVLCIGIALGVLAIFGLSATIIYIFKRWEAGQAAGIKALATSKDKTKQEITDLLKSELGNSRAANAADYAEFKEALGKHAVTINFMLMDLAIIGQKTKIQLRSSPTIHVISQKEE